MPSDPPGRSRQRLAIALIAVVTAVLAALIVWPRHDDGGHDHAAGGAQADGHAHADGRAQADDRTDADGRTHADGQPPAGGSPNAEAGGTIEPSPPQRLVRLDDAQRATAGIGVEPARLTPIDATVTLPGEIRLDEDRTAHVVARVAGVVQSVQVLLGQSVAKGQVLAVIASPAVSDMRASLRSALQRQALAGKTLEREKRLWTERISAEQDYLQAQADYQAASIDADNARLRLAAFDIAPSMDAGNRFELRAPFAGIVLAKHATLGEHVGEESNVYTIADLSSVWATFNVTAADLAAVKLGAPATVTASALQASAHGKVSYIGSLIGEATRMAVAHVTLANPDGAWRPGLFVDVAVQAGRRRDALTIPDEAIQTVDGRPQVFVETPDGFVARAVRTGAGDGRRIEIVEGLAAGERVAAANAFVLRSELDKHAASHSH
ncbi:MAG: efflux RND transporter periplasmic adaptor subunit [Burkholderiaceae bacterium]